MARMDKRRTYKMAEHSQDGATKPPYNPPPPYHVSNVNANGAQSSSRTSSNSQQKESQAKLRSYDSFKRIIEGPTYHPSHSRESSQASTGSAEHLRTSSKDSTNSEGRLSRHSTEYVERATENREQGLMKQPVIRQGNNNHHQYSSECVSNSSRGAISQPTSVHGRSYKNDALSQDCDKLCTYEERLRDLPSVHRPRDHSKIVPPLQERASNYSICKRPEPDGEESAKPQSSSQPELRHMNHDELDAAPARRKHRLQRQHGVHITDDVLMIRQPRPKTEYLDRTDLYEEQPVRIRKSDIGSRRGYVNSAYIEDAQPQLEPISENVKVSVDSQESDKDLPRHRDYTQHNPADIDPSFKSDILRKDRHLRDQNSRQVQRQPLQRNRDDELRNHELQRQYMQNKHNSRVSDIPCGEEGRYSRTKNQTYFKFPPYMNSNESFVHDDITDRRYPNYAPHRSGQYLHRPVSVSPERKKQRQYNLNDIHNTDAQPQEVGLQKYVRNDSKTKGGAVMVHVVPSSEKPKSTSGKTSPVIINVGEMTWEKIKRQVSKKNIYVVQPEEERPPEVRLPSKPRTHFTLSLFTMCFCLSPLGFIAMIFAVCSASAYKDRDAALGRCLSKVALILSIVGIIGTFATAAILIGTNTIPVIGRYGEPEGN